MNSTEHLAAVDKHSKLDSKTFTHEIREVSAYVPDQETFWKTIKAGLLSDCRAEIENVTPAAGAYLPLLRRTFLQLLDEGSIQLIDPISKLAENEIIQLRRLTGIGNVPAPVVQKTAQGILEAQVVSDFTNLSGDAFRAKLNGSTSYRAAYRKLAEAGRIAVGSAPRPAASAERELAADERYVKVDQTRFVRHIDGAQVSVTEDRALALVLSAAEAQVLVSRLKRGHFPQAVVSE